ncbi:MAG TPA: hypothetical protein VMT17_11830 [Anaeromyxobacteraceae bacterium]|nr:hypothetical protein [Anaeromyxobacteraceae bacterium]
MHRWTWAVPLVAAALLGAASFLPDTLPLALLAGAALVGAVLAAVHHAEVVAHKVGEPLGTLVLALAVTVIECALIISMMVAGGPAKAPLARDTVYSTVMIISSGVIGTCIVVGGIRYREQSFRIEGAGPAFAALVTLATLVLVLPVFTTSAPGAAYSPSQMVFAGVASLTTWGVFVFLQTVRHRDYFLPAGGNDAHVPAPSGGAALASLALLLVALVSVVGLAKQISPRIEAAVRAVGAPQAAVGIAIALLVLLPETVAAIRAARADRLQTSINLALGSALATIGLTVPVVVAVSLIFGLPVILGLDPKEMVLLGLTFIVGAITLGSGRTNLMQGAVQLVVFAAFLFLSLVP